MSRRASPHGGLLFSLGITAP